MKTLIITLSLMVLSLVSIAQDKVDFVSIGYTYNPGVGLRSNENGLFDNDKNIDVTEFKADFKFPYKFKNDKTILINGLKWLNVRAPIERLNRNFLVRSATVNSFRYELGLVHQFSDKWGVVLRAQPTLASNFRSFVITSDDFFFQGVAAVTRKVSSELKYGVGISYTNAFGQPTAVPVAILKYEKDEFTLDVKAPHSIKVKYKLPKMTYGFEAELEGGKFHLTNRKREFQSEVIEQDFIRYSRYNIGPVVARKLNDQSRLQFSAGISLARVFDIIEEDGTEVNIDLNNGMFFKFSYHFGI